MAGDLRNPDDKPVFAMADFRVSPDGLTPTVDEESPATLNGSVEVEDTEDIEAKWGFPLPALYKLSLTFYRGKGR